MEAVDLARAFRAFADALETPRVISEEIKAHKPAKLDQFADKPKDDEPKEITLADVQELGAALIRAGKRSELRELLTEHGLKNLSSVKPEQFQAIAVGLSKVLN